MKDLFVPWIMISLLCIHFLVWWWAMYIINQSICWCRESQSQGKMRDNEDAGDLWGMIKGGCTSEVGNTLGWAVAVHERLAVPGTGCTWAMSETPIDCVQADVEILVEPQEEISSGQHNTCLSHRISHSNQITRKKEGSVYALAG
jgi:hypothetical protein